METSLNILYKDTEVVSVAIVSEYSSNKNTHLIRK